MRYPWNKTRAKGRGKNCFRAISWNALLDRLRGDESGKTQMRPLEKTEGLRQRELDQGLQKRTDNAPWFWEGEFV